MVPPTPPSFLLDNWHTKNCCVRVPMLPMSTPSTSQDPNSEPQLRNGDSKPTAFIFQRLVVRLAFPIPFSQQVKVRGTTPRLAPQVRWIEHSYISCVKQAMATLGVLAGTTYLPAGIYDTAYQR